MIHLYLDLNSLPSNVIDSAIDKLKSLNYSCCLFNDETELRVLCPSDLDVEIAILVAHKFEFSVLYSELHTDTKIIDLPPIHESKWVDLQVELTKIIGADAVDSIAIELTPRKTDASTNLQDLADIVRMFK